MRPEHLIDAIGEVEEEFLQEVDSLRREKRIYREKKKNHRLQFLGVAIAACFVVVVGIGLKDLYMNQGDTAIDTMTMGSMEDAGSSLAAVEEAAPIEGTEEATMALDNSRESDLLPEDESAASIPQRNDFDWVQMVKVPLAEKEVAFALSDILFAEGELADDAEASISVSLEELLSALSESPETYWTPQDAFLSDLDSYRIYEELSDAASQSQCLEVMDHYLR